MVRAISLTAVLGLAVTAAAQETHFKTPSTWKQDTAKSDYGGQPAPKSDVITVLKDTNEQLTWQDVSTDANGKTVRTSWSGPEDGQARSVQGMEGMKASFKTDGSSHWEYPDGSKEDDKLAFSDDGKTMQIEGKLTGKDGKEVPTKYVYTRVK